MALGGSEGRTTPDGFRREHLVHDAVSAVRDEAGGHYDHAAPMPVDRFGPSTRVPAIVISPFAKRGYIDHTNYTVASILKTIETRYDLPSLINRDGLANTLLPAFDFSQSGSRAFARQSLGTLSTIPVAEKSSASVPAGAHVEHDE